MAASTTEHQRSVSQRLPRLTRKVFTDLAIWMVGFGLVMGSVFPPAIVLLGVPSEYAYRPGFVAATLTAGLIVGLVNYALAYSVVGARVRLLSGGMAHITTVLEDATYRGDWEQCRPEECTLPVDSDDALGDASASFNRLLTVLAASRGVEEAMSGFTARLTAHLDVADLAEAALDDLIVHAGADAGALCLVRDGALTAEASVRVDVTHLCENPTLLDALRRPERVLVEVPEGLQVDGSLVSFRPAAVAILPVTFKATPVAVAVLAFRAQPAPETLRLLELLRSAAGVALNNALAYERFQHLAAVDPLTGVYNRRFGFSRLKEEWGRAIRSEAPLGLLAFDLDHFKAVNDTHGHLMGDRVLKEVTATVRLVLREGDIFVRTGGEEFLVVLPGAGSDDTAGIAERLRRAVETLEVHGDGSVVRPTVSVGSAVFPLVSVDSPEQLAAQADEALYAAKRTGRNRVVSASGIDADALVP